LFEKLDGRLQVICRLLLNTGLRPPKEILRAEKAHVNLSDKPKHYKFTERDGQHLAGQHVIIPPRSLLVAHGKDGTTRLVPLNQTAHSILQILCQDKATGVYLFTGRDGEPMESFKKGFAAACQRAEIEDLRPYDLRHTFATRLLERNVQTLIISALMGHSASNSGESRITFGYAHATWRAMVWGGRNSRKTTRVRCFTMGLRQKSGK
jgi:integrase